VLFFERDRGELGVSADRAESHDLFDAALPSLVHQLHPHHQVIVEELRWPSHISADPAHMRRQVNDDIGLGNLEHAGDILALHQVIFWVARDENIPGALALQVAYQMLAQKAGAARDANALGRKINRLIHIYLEVPV